MGGGRRGHRNQGDGVKWERAVRRGAEGKGRGTADIGLVDHHFLSQKDLLRRDFHAKVTACDHDAVSPV